MVISILIKMKISFKCTFLFDWTKIDLLNSTGYPGKVNRVLNSRIILNWIEWQEQPFSVNEDLALLNHIDWKE